MSRSSPPEAIQTPNFDQSDDTLNGSIHDESRSFDDAFGNLSLTGSSDLQTDCSCQICNASLKTPRVLTCLHVFCEHCLDQLLDSGLITCPTCRQVTECKSASNLPLDYVTANCLDMQGIEDMQMTCTSCKAKEKAVARCSDCANFLCTGCVTAHQFMRCFENHKVVSFSDITKGDGLPIHRPITCSTHDGEVMKFFCTTCEMPICNECLLSDHRQPGHQYERIGDVDVEHKQVAQVVSLVSRVQERMKTCEKSASMLQSSLLELEAQRDDARSLINETFQSYKAILERKQAALLSQLDQLHKQQELTVMEMFYHVNGTVEKIQHSCDFVNRYVSKSNNLELLSLKKTMCDRLNSLLNNAVETNPSMDIEFVSDRRRFEAAVQDNFGYFKLHGETFTRNPLQNVRQITGNREAGTALASSPTPSLQLSGYSSSMSELVPLLGSSEMNAPHDPRPILASHHSDFLHLSAFLPANSNSDQLGLRNATVPNMNNGMLRDDRSVGEQSQSPTISDSGINMDTNSPVASTPVQQLVSVASLAKLGPVSVSAQGQIMLNNQVLPGLTVHNVTGLHLLAQSDSSTNGLPSPDTDLGSGFATIRSPLPIGDSLFTQRRDSHHAGQSSPPDRSDSISGFTSPTQLQLPFAARGKMSAMQIRAKFGQLGPGKGQFNSPHGFCMGLEEDIVVADTNNHRIQVFDKTGEFKYQFGIPGREEGQLWYPRKVAVMRGSGRYVICDRGNERSRMQIFTKNGHFVKKIAIRYIDIVAGLAITQQGNIVAVDSVSPTVFTISENGDLIKWFDCSDFMREPSDIAINDKEYYVCDFKGHCVVVFNEDGQFQRRIGTDTITNFPNGIDISDAGDVLVGDSHGNRFHVAVFQRDGSLIGEFECPYVKVSRCCGLKITAEGYVVTLAKNNHHVLVLNTLYIS